MAEFIFLLIGNVLLIGISISFVVKKKIFSSAWAAGTRHLIFLFLALVVLGMFCGVFVLLNSLEGNDTLIQSLVKGATAGLYVISSELLGFFIVCGFLLIWRKGGDVSQLSSKMFR
jgi:hypothetical protein